MKLHLYASMIERWCLEGKEAIESWAMLGVIFGFIDLFLAFRWIITDNEWMILKEPAAVMAIWFALGSLITALLWSHKTVRVSMKREAYQETITHYCEENIDTVMPAVEAWVNLADFYLIQPTRKKYRHLIDAERLLRNIIIVGSTVSDKSLLQKADLSELVDIFEEYCQSVIDEAVIRTLTTKWSRLMENAEEVIAVKHDQLEAALEMKK